MDLFFERRNDAVRVEVTEQQGEIEVVATHHTIYRLGGVDAPREIILVSPF